VIGTSRASQASETEPRLGAVDAEYRADVDGLRGVAIALVCLFHADLWPFTGGYVGVDVFFVISGFVITRVLLRDLERGSLSVPRFLLRRVRRLAPAAIVMLIVCMAIFTLVYPPKYLVGFGESTVAQSLFASNVYFWRTTDYFGTPPDARPLLHTWSLAVEEQFYLLFSVGIVLLSGMRRRGLAIAMAACLALSFALAAALTVRWPSASFYLLPTRAWELLTGAVLAAGSGLGGTTAMRSPIVRQILAWTGLTMIGASAVVYDAATPFPDVYAALPVLGTAALIFANTGFRTTVGAALSARPLLFLGRVSYSLYLWHWVALVLVHWTAFGQPRQSVKLAAIAVAVLFAYASWRWIENPVRARTVLRSDRALLATAGVATLLTIGYGYAAASSAGFPARAAVAMDAPSRSPREGECFDDSSVGSIVLCDIGVRTAEPASFVVIGDSHALAMLPALDELAAARGLKGLFGATSGCAPLVGAVPIRDAASMSRCRALVDQALALAERQPVRHVVLVARWDYYTEVGPDGGFQPITNTDARIGSVVRSRRVFDQQFTATVDAFARAGVSLDIVLQAPHQRMDPESFVFRKGLPRYLGGIAPDLDGTLDFKRHLLDQRFTSDVFQRARVATFDPAPLLCPAEGICRMFTDGRSLYWDDDHLSEIGAHYVAPALEPLLARIAGRSD
jgi:peptidoglycan/LPS O-acetylase OafA/YrhL